MTFDFTPETAAHAESSESFSFKPAAPRLRAPRPLIGECRICTTCKKSQDLSEFAIKNAGRARRCRACQKVLSDAAYQRRKDEIKENVYERNVRERAKLVKLRDNYLSKCCCEACSSTVDLRLTVQPGYTGMAMHEVMAGPHSRKVFDTALANSKVLCGYCMGGHYGKVGGRQKAANRLLAEQIEISE